MKKSLLALGLLVSGLQANAAIPYCEGTIVKPNVDKALQSVIEDFAKRFSCEIGENCITNFAQVKYHISWAKPCQLSAAARNDPNGSTMICSAGVCRPLGFSQPSASYTEE